jgi:ligand-binding SRPBCC domain-containing protein
MSVHRLYRKQFLPIPLAQAWDFFSRPENLNRLTPPEMSFEILSGQSAKAFGGQILIYKVQVMPGIKIRWVTEIKHLESEVQFVDEQRKGPYAFWFHRHGFTEVEGGVVMEDEVHYDLGFGPLGDLMHALWVRGQLRHIFDYRAQALAEMWPGARLIES